MIKKKIKNLYKKILQRIIDRLVKDAKCFGVQLEKDMPPEYIVTDHGLIRMKQRMRKDYSDSQARRVALEAWKLGSDTTDKYRTGQKYRVEPIETKKRIYRSYRGYLFVYGVRYPPHLGGLSQKVLITVLD